MPAFDYSAYDAKGKTVKGVISGDSERHVRKLLKDKQLFARTVVPVTDNTASSNKNGFFNRISNLDLAMILRQQAILIRSGLPLEDAMRMTVEQAETERQRRLVASWRSEIIEGRSLSDAMKRSPYIIPEAVIAGIGVGEESGHLHGILGRMADEIESSAENAKTLKRALIYPVSLVVVSAIVVAVMMIFVVPKITAVFMQSGRELPWVTRMVVSMSEFLSNYGLYLLVLLIASGFAIHFALRDPVRRQAFHKKMMAMPLFGRWIMMSNIADWSRSLGTLLESGVPALSALKISSSVVNNLHMRAQLLSVTEGMRRGASLKNALEEQNLGSGFLVHMVGSGEASSELDSMLLRVSEYYSSRLSNAVNAFLQLINPLLIILMGVVVLTIVAAVMLPIIEMNDAI